MMTYDQAAAVISKKDAYDFFTRNGYQVTNQNPTQSDIAEYFAAVVKAKGDTATADLKALAEASAKKLGGCKCGGNCGCGGGKPVNKEMAGFKSFAKEHSTLLIAGGFLIALALIIKSK